ncbi:MAG: thioredoxin [Acholeplasmataceae bacterium]|nr:thioredoxin [Acholeplasmataceae bacterium]
MLIIHLTTENFKSEVLESRLPVLVDFWAGWCSPCHRLTPILDELSAEVEGLAKVCKLEVDEEYEVADAYSIMSIPSVIVFKDGKIHETTIGVQSKETLRKLLGV